MAMAINNTDVTPFNTHSSDSSINKQSLACMHRKFRSALLQQLLVFYRQTFAPHELYITASNMFMTDPKTCPPKNWQTFRKQCPPTGLHLSAPPALLMLFCRRWPMNILAVRPQNVAACWQLVPLLFLAESRNSSCSFCFFPHIIFDAFCRLSEAGHSRRF
jgi:hypothetical protein